MSNYKRLGDYIREVDVRNLEGREDNLLGVSVSKEFIKSVANTVGTDFTKYKTVRNTQFTYIPDTSRRGDKIGIAMYANGGTALVSQAYTVFEITDTESLLPEYLMMWFRRPEFDRYARFRSHGSVREMFDWEELCNTELPIPSPEKQREIVAEYNAVQRRIDLNNQLIQKLEETAQAIYKQWFVDFEFPNEDGKSYKSSGGEMVDSELGEIPRGWRVGALSDIANIIMGQSPEGESYNSEGNGMIFYQGRTDFGIRFPDITTYTTEPKKRAKKGDILMSVRAPVGDLNITKNDCAIGRGIASLNSKTKHNSFLFHLMLAIRNEFDVSNDEGTIFGSITKEALYQSKIIIPNNKTIQLFEDTISILDKNIELFAEQDKKLKELQSLLLSKMATIKN
ncbi:restriction endonuclease subunit S [Bacteroidales bacterium OttesenSCG-928-K03]|nr:restriction endonuclease subunit S [Odoribacter sp. OttesenSCG-928-L07]MDL2239647.1 restriction endonuclease subunit S [Bacteroidales bacterium OttesenSCG-928-L14]MDL2243020.1 restriction endonuclease subunit S [Bacteroidales bacterium OttesenSCG-928-K03]